MKYYFNPVEMPFPQPIRQYWLKVADGRDQTFVYDEKRGFHIKGTPATEIDHIYPESELELQGLASVDRVTGVPRSRASHVGRGRVIERD